MKGEEGVGLHKGQAKGEKRRTESPRGGRPQGKSRIASRGRPSPLTVSAGKGVPHTHQRGQHNTKGKGTGLHTHTGKNKGQGRPNNMSQSANKAGGWGMWNRQKGKSSPHTQHERGKGGEQEKDVGNMCGEKTSFLLLLLLLQTQQRTGGRRGRKGKIKNYTQWWGRKV